MADRAEQVSTTGLVDTKQQPGATKRRQYSEASKRQMVAETLVPGASVSVVARPHDVNSNQLFRWRRQLLPKAVVESGTMVPVEIAAEASKRVSSAEPESIYRPRSPPLNPLIQAFVEIEPEADRTPIALLTMSNSASGGGS